MDKSDIICLLLIACIILAGIYFFNFVLEKVQQKEERDYNKFNRLNTYPLFYISGTIITKIEKYDLIYIDQSGWGSWNSITLKILLLTTNQSQQILVLNEREFKVNDSFNDYIKKCKSLNGDQIFYLYFGKNLMNL